MPGVEGRRPRRPARAAHGRLPLRDVRPRAPQRGGRGAPHGRLGWVPRGGGGAAASCGLAFALLAGNSPLRMEGWSEGQLLVADIHSGIAEAGAPPCCKRASRDILRGIAEAGAPRCCKRDSRIAVAIAVPWFNGHLGTHMTTGEETPACGVSGANSACLGRACPYFAELR